MGTRYYLTTRTYCNGSGKWISGRWSLRIVAVPEGAATKDLRSPGVKVLWESPILATYYSHGSNIETPTTRDFMQSFNAGRVAAELGVQLSD
jgi:hypothetical protein